MHDNILMYDWEIVFKVDCILLVPLAFLTAILFIIWNVYFLKKVRFFITQRSQALEKAKCDILGNFAQLAENHKIEIVKYCFLSVISNVELFTIIVYAVAFLASYIVLYTKDLTYFPENVNKSNCSLHYVNFKNAQSLSSRIPALNFSIALGQIGVMLIMTLCVCLVKYLHASYFKIGGSTRWILRFLFITLFICIVKLICSVVPALMIFYFLFGPVFQFFYLYLFVKYLRIFRRTLKRQTIDLKIICKPKATIETSIRLRKQFTVVSTLNCFGFGCLIFAESLDQYVFVISIALYFAPCFTEYAYGRVLYQAPLVNTVQFDQLQMAVQIIDWIANAFFIVACICIASHFTLVSLFLFSAKVRNDLKMRFGNRFRYSPIITQPLLQ